MRLRTAAFVTAAAFSLAILPSAAQGYGPHGHGLGHGQGRGDANPILHMAQELGLSDAQMTQVKAITAKYMQGSLRETMDAMREARATVRKTVHDTAATDDQVREAAAVVAVLESQSAVEHHRMAIEISGVLTAEQREKLAESLADVAERRPGPPPGGPGGF